MYNLLTELEALNLSGEVLKESLISWGVDKIRFRSDDPAARRKAEQICERWNKIDSEHRKNVSTLNDTRNFFVRSKYYKKLLFFIRAMEMVE